MKTNSRVKLLKHKKIKEELRKLGLASCLFGQLRGKVILRTISYDRLNSYTQTPEHTNKKIYIFLYNYVFVYIYIHIYIYIYTNT